MLGRTLNHYRINSKLGSGGMGQVYQATDTKLEREVAIKFLSREFAQEKEHLRRFQREARLLASLNHPNIATIHGIEEAEGESYLVMELVPGRTLQEVIAGKRPGLKQTVEIAGQIAAALQAAHEKGVVHRDLKPANVKITPEDVVKVLDFGLAKSLPSHTGDSVTLTAAPTEGVLVGTPGYMSPEQAQGRELDRRSDVWSFGCVLYELLTGRKAFSGASAADRIAAVLTREPNWSLLPADTPAALRKLLRRCVAKERTRRYQDMGDVRLELEELFDTEIPAAPSQTVRRVSIWTALMATIGIAALGLAIYWSRPADIGPETWSSELLGVAYPAIGPRISPDGQTLAFQAFKDALNQVAVFKPGSGDLTVQLLTQEKTSGIINDIAWSSDGTRLYYDRYDRVLRGIFSVPVLGGEPRLILDNAKGPQPVADGSLLVTRINEKRQNQLYRFWPQDRRLQALNALLPRAGDVWTPPVRVFPDGKEAVFYGRPLETSDAANQLYAIDLESNLTRRLAPAVSIRPTTEYFALSVDPNGRFVLVDKPDGDLHRILEVPRSGGNDVRTLLTLTMGPWFMDVARDGSIYVDQVHRPSELLRFPVSGGAPEQLGISPSFVSYGHGGVLPLPDGRVLMGSSQGGRDRLLVTSSGGLLPFLETAQETSPPVAVLGENEVALVEGNESSRRIAIASIPDDRIVRRLNVPADQITSMAASPDGGTIYYVASGVVWAVPSKEGVAYQPRGVTDGDGVAVDPRNGDLVVQTFGAEGVRLVRWPERGPAQEISFQDDSFVMWPIPLSPNAVGSDGRILVQGGAKNTWSYQVGVIDPAKKSVQIVRLLFDGDMAVPGWTKDGRIVSIGFRYRMNLWRFRRTAAEK